MFEYLSQPPTELSCNPYDNSSGYPKWQPTVPCVLVRQYGTQEYSVQWFYKNATHTKTVGADQFFASDIVLTVLNSLRDTPYDGSLGGYYWCQAIIGGNNEYIPLERSNILEVREPDYYEGLPPCPNILQSGMRCADLGSDQTTPTASPTESPTSNKDDTVWRDATIAMICIICCILAIGVVLLVILMLHIMLKHRKAPKSKEQAERKRSICKSTLLNYKCIIL